MNVMATSTMVWFTPTKNYWNALRKIPWRYKSFVDCGAGMGTLTAEMRKRGFLVRANDLLPRNAAVVNDIEVVDAQHCDARGGDCAIIARPCHGTDWVVGVVKNFQDCGDVLYVGLEKNVASDLNGTAREVIARDVGEEGEVMIRVYCLARDAREYRIIDNRGREEGWWYRGKRYCNDSHGYGSGFYDGGERVIRSVLRGNDWQTTSPKERMCSENSDLGWCSPEGEWFGCHSIEHDMIAMNVIGAPVGNLEETGWVRCYGGDRMTWSRGWDQPHEVNEAQKRTMRKKGYNV